MSTSGLVLCMIGMLRTCVSMLLLELVQRTCLLIIGMVIVGNSSTRLMALVGSTVQLQG